MIDDSGSSDDCDYAITLGGLGLLVQLIQGKDCYQTLPPFLMKIERQIFLGVFPKRVLLITCHVVKTFTHVDIVCLHPISENFFCWGNIQKLSSLQNFILKCVCHRHQKSVTTHLLSHLLSGHWTADKCSNLFL